MAKSLFEFFQWSNPKSSALSEEQAFFDENASLFNEPLSIYNDPTSLFGLIRANILLLSLKNREFLFHYIERLSEDNLKEEKTRDALFKRLSFFEFKGRKIFVPTFSPQINEKLYKTPWVFKSFSVFYHVGFATIFVIDDQGNLEQEIPLKDEGLKTWPPENLFQKLVLVMEDYFRLDKMAFLNHLLEYGLISRSLHDDALKAIHKREEKRAKRLSK